MRPVFLPILPISPTATCPSIGLEVGNCGVGGIGTVTVRLAAEVLTPGKTATRPACAGVVTVACALLCEAALESGMRVGTLTAAVAALVVSAGASTSSAGARRAPAVAEMLAAGLRATCVGAERLSVAAALLRAALSGTRVGAVTDNAADD